MNGLGYLFYPATHRILHIPSHHLTSSITKHRSFSSVKKLKKKSVQTWKQIFKCKLKNKT